jgi:hypothetical protein
MGDNDLVDLYYSKMTRDIDLDAHPKFTVRQWDGMDGCWADCVTDVDRDEALRVWAEYTKSGTQRTSYHDIDYYRIFPADTKMLWDGSDGQEMFR